MSDKIKDLAKKLRALADRGVDGEKINAEIKLTALLAKHGLSIADLDDDRVNHEQFIYKNGQAIILSHVIWRTMPDVKIWGSKRKRNAFIIECTHAQKIEILALFDFYRKAYLKELKIFNKAFILKNDLATNPKEGEQIPEMSNEEAMKLRNLMKGIDQQNRFKAQLKEPTV